MSSDSQRLYYYSNLFPYEDCCRWFSYGNGYILSLREIAFGQEDKTFFRYLSFNSAYDFKLNARRLSPDRIDIGSIYNISPPLAHPDRNVKMNFKVTQKEMVFDIDISDYDEVRHCCKESNICQKCWKYMAFACKILDAALREDFGFKNILWTFSGGRGVHCWVCDEKARKLRVKERAAIADYLQVIKGGGFNKKKVYFNQRPHPSIQRALRIIEPKFFEICVEEQNIFENEEKIEQFLEILSTLCESDTIKDDLKPIFQKYETSNEKWEALKSFLKSINKWRNSFVIEELMLQFAYPRIDVNVTTVLTHLLKCPFSPHVRTKKICIPFDPAKVDDFDPDTAPNISSLFQESQFEKDGTNLQKFHESLDIFKKFVDGLEKYEFHC